MVPLDRHNLLTMKPALLCLMCLFLSSPVWSNVDAAFDDIDQLIRLRDYSTAVSRLNRLAEKGNPEAQYRLAGLYRSGKGVGKDLDRAADLYYQSAQAGHGNAQYTFALIIEKSKRSSSSLAEAHKWYKKSAAQGNERALLRLEQLEEIPIEDQIIDQADIFNAIRHNDEALIKSLVAKGVNLSLTDLSGNSTLMAALLAGRPRMASLLIPGSKQLEQENALGSRPIHIASARGYTANVIDLLEKNVDVNQADARGDTALMLAVKNNNADIAELLLDLGAKLYLVNDKKQSAADLAATTENPRIKALFSAYGIKPGPTGKAKVTASLDTFKTRVRKQGSRYAGWPLLNIAIELGETSIANQLIRQKSNPGLSGPEGNNALHMAARSGDSGTLRRLLQNGAMVNSVNHMNETALYLAVEAACLKCVRLLLANKANPAIANRHKITPLEVAVQNSQPRIAQTLLATRSSYPGIHRVLLLAVQKRMENLSMTLIKLDPELAAIDDNDRSVLWYSVDQGLEKMVNSLMITNKFDLNQRDINGYSPLAQAAYRGRLDIVRKLMQGGASAATLTNQKNSPLMLASLSGNTKLVGYLIDAGVDINVQNEIGDTALIIAAAEAKNEIVKLLISAGANLQLRNQEELNAYQIARNSGHQDTADLIRDNSNVIFKLFN